MLSHATADVRVAESNVTKPAWPQMVESVNTDLNLEVIYNVISIKLKT